MKRLIVALLLTFASSVTLGQAQRQHRVSFLLNYAPLGAHTSADVQRVGRSNPKFFAEYQLGFGRGYRPLTQSWGNAEYRPIAVMIQTDAVNRPQLARFRVALMREKRKLMSLYNLRNDTYNRLAMMSLGIFGNETEFGTSTRYALKENNQWLVRFLKGLRGDREFIQSRGGTQVKEIPQKIRTAYPEIRPDTLRDPRNAAIATVGYLAETFQMLLTRSRADRMNGAVGRASLTYIQPYNVFDYMPYVYSGRMNRLFRGPHGSMGATVVDNLYVLGMKNNMRHFYFMERP